ncbi:ABC transporter permease [Geomicrobium sp. JCM 19038]|uniref:ABC transporter permease n=1 Tax=Geomicrobium sp. JCM 19038 TaxID=1460635 RepID=UPI0005A8A566|nr:ABC transporter permease [Geomicrobium sp. JCM 19038]
MSIDQLWQERAREFWSVSRRYITLMANSGLMVAIGGIVLIIGIYYNSFLDWLPSTFPVVQVLAVLFAFMLTKTSVRTFFQTGDLVYLLPMEAKMNHYLQSALRYSWFMQSIVLALVLFLLGPLYTDRIGEFNQLLITFLILIAAKGWNVFAYWSELRYQYVSQQWKLRWLRFAVNLVFVFFVFMLEWLFVLAVGVVMILLLFGYYRPLHEKYRLKWDQLISLEEERLNSFYTFANAFVDVPHIKARVRRRSILSNQWNRLVTKRSNTYVFLYGKTFARSGDYFGIMIRLAIVGALLIYATPEDLQGLAVVIAILFTYITGSQLVTIYHHHKTMVWPELYPVPEQVRQQSVQSLVRNVMVIQSIWFTIITFITSWSIFYSMIALFMMLLMVIAYVKVQLPKWFKQSLRALS